MAADPFAPRALFSWPLFSSVVEGHAAHQKPLIDLILAQRDAGDGVVHSNRQGAWHADPGFMELRDVHLGWVLSRFAAFAEQALAPMYGGWKTRRLLPGSYWANVQPAGGFNAPHHHHPEHWSGVYYVSVPDTGSAEAPRGHIEFLAPSPLTGHWGANHHAVRPRPGLLLLFPAGLLHLVHPHDADEERISIATNFSVTGRGEPASRTG